MTLNLRSERVRLALAAAVALVLLPAALLATGVGASMAFSQDQHLREQFRAVVQHRSALRQAYDDLLEAETSQRGYLLTGREEYLQPFLRAQKDLPQRLAKLNEKSSTAEAKAEAVTFGRLAGLKLAELSQTIDLRRQGDARTAMAIVNDGEGQLLIDRVRNVVRTSKLKDDASLARLDRAEDRAEKGVSEILLALALATLATLGVTAWVVVQALRARGLAAAEAEEAARVKSDFLSNMSHELRTPLTSILGFGALLADQTGLDETGARALDRVRGSSQALLAIVNDILDFSKLESGQVAIDPQPLEARAFLSDTLSLLEPQADEKGLTLTFDCPQSLPGRLRLDETRVRQVMLNLLSNAVKFTAEGGVTLRVLFDHETEVLRCDVTDTGLGVPADKRDRLFQRFSQVDASTTRRFGGTGLGLAICKGLIEAMGGRIGVTSVEGEGSTFWFEIPAAPCAAAPRRDPLEQEASLDGVRLLVVDDNPLNREVARALFSSVGMSVKTAESGRAGVEIAQTTPFDLILMDLRMPAMDGIQAARLIRALAGPNRDIPILAFSADNEGANVADGPELFNGMVQKPIDPQTCFRTLAHWAWGLDEQPTERRAA